MDGWGFSVPDGVGGGEEVEAFVVVDVAVFLDGIADD